ncbi:MAG TPA: hypothetical protein VM939_06120 [Gemmatimonadaceae bacterium]|nr:hypothetical protein [Gemmatimonadaceae bacterium]
MTKAKTNALDALRALIAERQQYEQWISTLESKRESTPDHVFERVYGDYRARLERVITDIRGHSEELQLSINALSSRLVEVAREEDLRRDALQEAELRAVVGEYDPAQWEEMRVEAERELEKISGDRESLDNQLSELRGIQKLSEVGAPPGGGTPRTPPAGVRSVTESPSSSAAGKQRDSTERDGARSAAASDEDDGRVQSERASASTRADGSAPESSDAGTAVSSKPADIRITETTKTPADQGRLSLDAAARGDGDGNKGRSTPSADIGTTAAVGAAGSQMQRTEADRAAPSARSGASTSTGTATRSRTAKTPPSAASGTRTPKGGEPRVDQAKTLKCPECGTPNYPTEWYCERCGGELATM